ncbi:MAG: F0F1 ATP synthase subunit B [Planctomycetes bacterium]|nr:F0F1 ATP synthase subunit B [Planctomycetota bacterium]
MNLLFAAEGGGDIFHVEPGFLIWSAVTFGILVLILWKLGWGPLTKMIEDREQKIRDDIASAEKARAEADKAMAEYKRQLDDAAAQAKARMDEARESADRLRESRVAETDREVADMKAKAVKDIESARLKALADIRKQVVDLSLAISKKVVSAKVDAKDHEKAAEEVLARAGDLG